MTYTLRSGFIALGLVLVTNPLSAEPLSFREAQSALPKGDRTIAVMPQTAFLDDKQRSILAGLRDTIPYYGALAVSPDEGLFVEWLNAAGQHHSRDAARAAALSHCEANRKSSSARCVVVLEVLPKGAKPDAALSLSAPAADALRDDYRKLKGPKAFAVSPSSGTFGLSEGGAQTALNACKGAGGAARDCVVVVAD
ncbi:5-aminolevulic acid synthase [Litoreibacter arenae]|uniref:5-aminolevulic acid synthase n=1 Tax=Litoreibacter arenae TaxID=491388 RepID=UPI0012B53016|nr:5-aminolevulic acid synthase [Litoreibacter arenae]